MPAKPASKWYAIADAAAYLGVSIESMRRWADSGKLECWTTPGGQRRFSQEMLDTLLSDERKGK